MVRARVTGESYYGDGDEPVPAGEIVEVSETRLESAVGTLERVDSDGDDGDEPSGDGDETAGTDGGGEESLTDADLEAILDETVTEIRDELTDGTADGALDRLAEIEAANKDRSTVLDAIERRQSAIEG